MHDRITAFQILTRIDLADAQIPVERRTDGLPVDGGQCFVIRCSRRVILALGFVVGRLGDDMLQGKILGAVQILPCKVEFCLRGAELGLLLPRVELDKELSVGGPGTGFKLDGLHDAREICAEHHTLR